MAGAAAFFAGAAFLTGAAFLAGAAFFAAAGPAGALATSFFAPDTTALNSAPGRNFGSLVALIFTVSPVRGFRPRRAFRACCSKTPKPLIATFSPLITAFFVSSMKASTISVTSRLLCPRRSATTSMSSALFTRKTPPKGTRSTECRHQQPSAKAPGTRGDTPALASPTPIFSLQQNEFRRPAFICLALDTREGRFSLLSA